MNEQLKELRRLTEKHDIKEVSSIAGQFASAMGPLTFVYESAHFLIDLIEKSHGIKASGATVHDKVKDVIKQTSEKKIVEEKAVNKDDTQPSKAKK